jgi:succinate dehydrogenase / fumarate reductase cytochrome b subunit
MGLWLVLFLMEHLLVNSQAALLVGESGRGFVELVNGIHNLPYLQAIEIVLLGVPIAFHAALGVQYLFHAKFNSGRSDGSRPSLPEYGRNRAFTWQRLTSWILLVGLVIHVIEYRFLEYPVSLHDGLKSHYLVRVTKDAGLASVAGRLGVQLYDAAGSVEGMEAIAAKSPLEKGEVFAVAPDFGTASLLTVRDGFKNPIVAALYTVFVLAACFHGFNGLWTFLVTWGVILKFSAQKAATRWAYALMGLITFFGLAAIWGTYWLNLKN